MTTPASRHLPPDTHRTAVNGCDVRHPRADSRTPVASAHPLRTQLEMFQQTIEQPHTTQVEVIAIDLPGHGESTAPTVDYPAGYFTDAVEGLPERVDLPRAADAGEPIRAPVGVILAARGNPRPARVVAVNLHYHGHWGGAPTRTSSRRTQVIASPRRSGPCAARSDQEAR